MEERKKLDPAVNRARVKESMKKIDRLNVYLPQGTIEKISGMGFKPSKFARMLILEEIERLESIKNKR